MATNRHLEDIVLPPWETARALRADAERPA
jgi:hypothetical protein